MLNNSRYQAIVGRPRERLPTQTLILCLYKDKIFIVPRRSPDRRHQASPAVVPLLLSLAAVFLPLFAVSLPRRVEFVVAVHALLAVAAGLVE